MRRNKRGSIPMMFIQAALLCLAVSVFPQTSENRLAARRYEDPKGYFRIVPPDGWQIKEYPQDPRGKVAFMGRMSNLDLRVLVNSVAFDTIDELVKFCQQVESRTGLSTHIKRTEFGGRPAVQRTFKARGLKFYAIDFLVGSVDHNIMYGAPAGEYEKYFPLVHKSIETYEAIVRKSSSKEILQHALAKKRRLAQLMMESGHYDLASAYVMEGLELSPQDPQLLELRKEIEIKQR